MKNAEKILRQYTVSVWEKAYSSVPKGIPELLNALTKRKLKMTVLSNKPQEFTVLTVDHLLQNWSFDVILGQRRVCLKNLTLRGCWKFVSGFRVSPEDFLYLGDTATDMKTAVAAGCFPVGVLWGFRTGIELKDNGAQTIIKKPFGCAGSIRLIN
ncbi:MAG: hypothetical protein CM1200mP28_14870 [Deltaproteobacteria bacterium]|nr:MAG: hypothetical protein CM1200mP28_14870 [Deltaproteobacteria bacterium]